MSSNLQSAIEILTNESAVTSTQVTPAEAAPKPFLVANDSQHFAYPVTRKVEAALDFEFDQGRMPA